jgi:nucleotide-binding universal stress UspA family protein
MFNRILIPTDLSDQSTAAVRYGVKLFLRLPGSRIRFFYASDRLLPTSTPIRHYQALKADLLQQDLGSLEEHIRRVLGEAGLPYLPRQMELHVENGAYLQTMETVLEDYAPDLVVMGTRGAGGLKKYLIGSNAVKTLNAAPCPVLAVPEGYVPASVPHIVYATDLEQWQQEVGPVKALAEMLDARLTVVHLHHSHRLEEKGREFGEVLAGQLQHALPGRFASVVLPRVSGQQDLTERLQQMIATAHPALLVMFSRKKSWLAALFADSRTQQVLYGGQVPVLAFKN